MGDDEMGKGGSPTLPTVPKPAGLLLQPAAMLLFLFFVPQGRCSELRGSVLPIHPDQL